ncbi:MAG: xylose ABC transporter ATP-binding protein [Spirochaetales bacterium]|nr:xylose ABC transporter ATP-binding protein [Spirochaetales bacterium]
MSEFVFEMDNISKEFPGVKALDNVSFRVKKGEIHALVGENGAGKSTLMKVLSGVHPFGSYTGHIRVKGEEVQFRNIRDSEHHGIVVIYQELALVRLLNIMENLFLGNEVSKNGIINWNEAFIRTQKYLKEVGLDVSPETRLINLGVGQQQLVEIAKALSKNAEILVLDEPTAALNEEDSKNLLKILRELKSKGVTCIYISHKLEEVLEIADSITVLRDGHSIHSQGVQDDGGMTEEKMINFMVGRKLTSRFPRKEHKAGEVVMEVKNWTVYHPELVEKKVIDNVSFQIRKGEILGIAGLMGAGRTELFLSLFGKSYGREISGEIFIDGKKQTFHSPRDAIRAGFTYLSEDRKEKGLVLGMDILSNTTLSSLEKVSDHGVMETFDKQVVKAGVINYLKEVRITNHYVKQLQIKTPSIEQKVKNLSGGNQQKVVIGKWLMTEPKILVLDEPTRGIDVGAKFEIYNLMNELIDNGVSIVLISSELPEVLGMSDRVLVIHQGRITGDLPWQEATQEKCMYYATGGK